MYFHIERIKFIKLEVETKTFNKIVANKLSEIALEKTRSWKKKLNEENQFIRFVNGEHYTDVHIVKILSKEHYIIMLGSIIDCSKKTTRDNKNHLNNRR